MYVLLLLLVGLFLIVLAIGGLRVCWYHKHGKSIPPVQRQRPDGCCGQHEVCEKESLLAAVSREIEYYDDEELDSFRGRPSNAYSEAEVEQFQDILYSMQSEEVAGWVRSLQLRGVNLPDELKDEVILIVGERRQTP